MRLIHYIEIENFKSFGEKQRIELDHPAVLIGPNNCGKTSTIQALALWSQAVRTWYDARKDSSARERTATSLNRLSIVSVPVQRTRFYWNNTNVRAGNKNIKISIAVGVEFEGEIKHLKLEFRNQGDEIIYCSPAQDVVGDLELIKYAANLRCELLYPMSGLDTDEPLLQPGRIDVLLGQGRTAQVLRNLCLMVYRASKSDWQRVSDLMKRLFNVQLLEPLETNRGTIDLNYRQAEVKEVLDVSSAGRGFQQMLLIFSYLFSHKGSLLMVDEPDAHLEILRQKQVYVLLRDIASENGSQVVMVTHSEVILEEALDTNLTLLVDGKADNLARKKEIQDSLKNFGAEHYIKARERGYILYVEGGTDVDMLRAFAEKIGHPVSDIWDERVNSFYVRDNYPEQTHESELERVEGGFGLTPKKHFYSLKKILPELKGLAILDNDGSHGRVNDLENDLKISYWSRYEAENYFIKPDILVKYAKMQYPSDDLFSPEGHEKIESISDDVVFKHVFDGDEKSFKIWKKADEGSASLIWESKTERKKLSFIAECFFKELAVSLGQSVKLRKGEFHRLAC